MINFENDDRSLGYPLSRAQKIACTIGVIVAVGGLFLLLASLRILPKGVNALSKLGYASSLGSGGLIAIAIALVWRNSRRKLTPLGKFRQLYVDLKFDNITDDTEIGTWPWPTYPKARVITKIEELIRNGDSKVCSLMKDVVKHIDKAENRRMALLIQIAPGFFHCTAGQQGGLVQFLSQVNPSGVAESESISSSPINPIDIAPKMIKDRYQVWRQALFDVAVAAACEFLAGEHSANTYDHYRFYFKEKFNIFSYAQDLYPMGRGREQRVEQEFLQRYTLKNAIAAFTTFLSEPEFARQIKILYGEDAQLSDDDIETILSLDTIGIAGHIERLQRKSAKR